MYTIDGRTEVRHLSDAHRRARPLIDLIMINSRMSGAVHAPHMPLTSCVFCEPLFDSRNG